MKIVEIACYSQLNDVQDTSLFKRREVNLCDRRIFAAIADDGAIMGLAQIVENSGVFPGNVGIGYIETFKSFRGKGVSKALVDAVFTLAGELNRGVRTGWFTSDGECYLRKVFEQAEARTGTVVIYH